MGEYNLGVHCIPEAMLLKTDDFHFTECSKNYDKYLKSIKIDFWLMGLFKNHTIQKLKG